MRPCRCCVCLTLVSCSAAVCAGQEFDPFAASSFVPSQVANSQRDAGPDAPHIVTNTTRYRWLDPMTRVRETPAHRWEPLVPALTIQRPTEDQPRLKLTYSSGRIQPNKLTAFGRVGMLRWNSPVADCTSDNGCRLNMGVRSNGAPKLTGKFYMGLYYLF